MEIVCAGDCTLILGDSLKYMQENDIKADCLVVDPPYLLIAGGNTKGGMKGGCFSKENYNNNGQIVHCEVDWPDFMPLFYKSLKDQAHAYIMSNNRHIANCENAALKAGFRLHNWLVWDKINATPNKWYMKNLEFTGFFFKGRAKPINDMGCNQLVRLAQKDVSDHPTEKPVALMEHYIRNSTQPGDLVLDPFAGSFTTAVACIRTGRRFIGMEIDPKHFMQGVSRIEDESKKTPLLF